MKGIWYIVLIKKFSLISKYRTFKSIMYDSSVFVVAGAGYCLYYIHFEITGDPCKLIGPQQCDLFTNRTILGSKSHPFFSSQWEQTQKENNQSNWIKHVFAFVTLDWDFYRWLQYWNVKAIPVPLFSKKAAARSIKYWHLTNKKMY